MKRTPGFEYADNKPTANRAKASKAGHEALKARQAERSKPVDVKAANKAKSAALTASSTSSAPMGHERIPAAVWTRLQAAGDEASQRLVELLQSARFEKLRTGDQVALMRLAFEYSYGKPDSPPKTEVKVKLSGGSSDAVSSALERLAQLAVDLPEQQRSDNARDITPE